MTFYGEVKSIQEDEKGYITYVIQGLHTSECKILGFENVTCTRFPNWECKTLSLGDIGYFNLDEKKAGQDCWYDGKNLIPYRYNFTQFISYLPPGKSVSETCIM
mgnify:FL=1